MRKLDDHSQWLGMTVGRTRLLNYYSWCCH